MADMFKANPFPRGLTGTASLGNYDVDLTFYPDGQNIARKKCVPSVITIVVESDAVIQFLGADSATVAGRAGAGGDTQLGDTVPLKSGVVYIMKVSADILRFVNSAVEYRIIAEY